YHPGRDRMSSNPDTAQPPGKLRLGPRPLPFHLLANAAMLMGSYAALPSLRNGSFDWKPHLRERAQQLRRDLEGRDPDQFAQALLTESQRRLNGFLQGVLAYRAHEHHRESPDVPVIWQEGTTRLLDYSQSGASGKAVLVIPSLINRSDILDLSPRRS